MANESKITNWVLSNSNYLDLKVDLFSWPKQLGFNFCDLQAKVTFDNKLFYGRGSHPNPEIALNKAITEVIERLHMQFSTADNSNGFAAHFDLHLAKMNAYFELIERDLFFCYFLTETKFPRLKLVEFLFFTEAQKILKCYNIDLRAYCLGKTDDWATTMVVAIGTEFKKPFGFCFGTSTKNTLENSITAGSIECLRQVSSLILGYCNDSCENMQ